MSKNISKALQALAHSEEIGRLPSESTAAAIRGVGFALAAIAEVGAAIVAQRELDRRRGDSDPNPEVIGALATAIARVLK